MGRQRRRRRPAFSRDTDALRQIVELVDQRLQVDQELVAAVHAARAAHRSWSEIGAMLGVSKQAAQRKYGNRPSPDLTVIIGNPTNIRDSSR